MTTVPLLERVMSSTRSSRARRGPAARRGCVKDVLRSRSSAKTSRSTGLDVATQKYMMELPEQQEILATLADLRSHIDAYGIDSAVGRAKMLLEERGAQGVALRARWRGFTPTTRTIASCARRSSWWSRSRRATSQARHRQKLEQLRARYAYLRIDARRKIADTCF